MTTSNDPFPWVVPPQHDPYVHPWPPNPYPWQPFTTGTINIDCEPPMMLRDRIAYSVMLEIVRARPSWPIPTSVVREAFEIADAFLRQRPLPSTVVKEQKENPSA